MLEKTKGEKKDAIVKIGEKREKERRKKPVTREHLRPSKRLSLSNGGKKEADSYARILNFKKLLV